MRILIYVFIAIIVLTAIRSLRIIVKGFTEAGGADSAGRAKSDVPIAGELRKDPVCGTYVSSSTQHKLGDVCFCSPECLAQYRKA